MGKHALLSASSSKRWLSCTPSARLEEQFRDEPGGSVYAEEGTAAHALAEHKLKKALKRRSKRPVSDYHCDEMEECTDGYVAFAMEQVELAKQECADPVVLIEQRLDYSAYVPEGFGTGDLLIVADKVLTVIDFKYGKGVPVDAEWNPQMMLYGLGALELFDALYDIAIIRMTIYQPRLESVSTWEVSVKDLMEWVEIELKPKAVLAIKGEGEFHSGDWCRFCRAKNTCRARAEEYLRLAQMEFKAPPLLSDEYYPPWEPPVSRFRATRKWYFLPSEPPQHIVAAHIFDFTINLLIVILGELLMQYHQIIYREVFLCLRRQKSEVFWNFWEKI